MDDEMQGICKKIDLLIQSISDEHQLRIEELRINWVNMGTASKDKYMIKNIRQVIIRGSE